MKNKKIPLNDPRNPVMEIAEDFDKAFFAESYNNKKEFSNLKEIIREKAIKNSIYAIMALKRLKDQEKRTKLYESDLLLLPMIEEIANSHLKEIQDKEKKRKNILSEKIIGLLKDRGEKMPASDIDAFLKHQDIDDIKTLCEDMYHNGYINRTSNYRYFILTEEKKTPKKRAAKKSDPTVELRKYAKLKDDGIITEEDFNAKKKELLGL